VPISNPSYFPAARSNGSVVGLTAGTKSTGARNFLALAEAGQNSTASDLIAIGNDSLGAGANGYVGTGGHICIGSNAGYSLSQDNGNAITDPAVIIGFNTYTNPASAGQMVVIGSNNLAQLPNGAEIREGPYQSIVIGHKILNGNNTLGANALVGAIIIGAGIFNDPAAGTLANSVIIGVGAATSSESLEGTGLTIIGQGACPNSIPGNDSTVIGAGALPNASSAAASNLIAIGAGAAPQLQSTSLPSCGIFIGTQAGHGFSQENGVLVLAPFPPDSGLFDSLIAGRLWNGSSGSTAIGNLCLGAALAADTDIDLPSATNIVKLINGTVGTANPTNGGYFYVDEGALHWVGSSGTDTTLASA
jgi:hypothetical protein